MDEATNSIFGFDYKALKANIKELKNDIGKVNKNVKHNIKKWLVSDLIVNQKKSDSNIQQINRWAKDMSQALYCTDKKIDLLEYQLFESACILGALIALNQVKILEVKDNKADSDKEKMKEGINKVTSSLHSRLDELCKDLCGNILKKKNR